MNRKPGPPSRGEAIAHYARESWRKRAEQAAAAKKYGIGAFKFPKSQGANSAAMKKGK